MEFSRVLVFERENSEISGSFSLIFNKRLVFFWIIYELKTRLKDGNCVERSFQVALMLWSCAIVKQIVEIELENTSEIFNINKILKAISAGARGKKVKNL